MKSWGKRRFLRVTHGQSISRRGEMALLSVDMFSSWSAYKLRLAWLCLVSVSVVLASRVRGPPTGFNLGH